jgi:hypothetical protein
VPDHGPPYGPPAEALGEMARRRGRISLEEAEALVGRQVILHARVYGLAHPTRPDADGRRWVVPGDGISLFED